MAETEQSNNRRGAIAGLVIAIVLLVVGIWLARELTAASKLQDCVMSSQIRKQNLGFQRRKNVAILPICNKTKREKLSAM
jgi:hypothetical protein